MTRQLRHEAFERRLFLDRLTMGILDPAALSDVYDRSQHEEVVPHPNRAQVDLDRNARAVFASAEELAAREKAELAARKDLSELSPLRTEYRLGGPKFSGGHGVWLADDEVRPRAAHDGEVRVARALGRPDSRAFQPSVGGRVEARRDHPEI